MSSADEDNAPSAKKRKLQRACDYCRRKKSKCDGPEMPDNRCSNCEARRIECTYKEPHRGNYPSSYAKTLESRLERMEKLMNKLCPDADLSGELEDQVSDRGSTARPLGSAGSRASTSRLDGLSPLSSLPISPQMPPSPDEADPSDNEEALDKGLIESLRKLSVSPQTYRYHGKASGLVLIRSAIGLANQELGSSGQVEPQEKIPHGYPWLGPPSQESLPVFGPDVFPPDDLLDTLVDLYFRTSNDTMPILHEPTFKGDIQRGLHLSQGGFGAVVLLICASAARSSSDPRVLLDGTDDWRSAGWKWYQAVEDWRKVTTSLAPAQLHDLQICLFMSNFLQGSAAPQANWPLIGSGLRMAVDVGAHRKKMYNTKFTIQDELWRRTFWALVVFEWLTGYGYGRPIFLHDDDIDVDLPTEVDDEYWTTSASDEPPRQPEGKPSKAAALVAFIRLTRILASALRTIYPIKRSKPHPGQDPDWEQRTVTDLDSSLNNWLDSLPAHLRWNPDQTDTLFLRQSAILYANYYLTQIAVHRPFMSASRRRSSLSLPSTIICTNAARSTLQILDVLHKRTGSPNHRNMGPLFMSGAILFMHILAQKRAGRLANVDSDIELLRRTVVMMDAIKRQSLVSGVLRDVLEGLVLAVNYPPRATRATMPQEPTRTTARSAGTGTSAPSASAPASVYQYSLSQGSDVVGTAMENIPQPAFPQTAEQSHLHNMSGHSMFGSESLGYGDTGSLFPSASGSDLGFDFGLGQHPTGTQQPETALQEGDLAMPDFAFMDDTLSMWSNAPTSFGLDDWGAYLRSATDDTNPGFGT
ncbi:fungal-specific transcription factor domain-containing protein [Cerioporus squamosus]|nr:fungal-specific transcription factor domain-containing protein [Cerioporus squamosus]